MRAAITTAQRELFTDAEEVDEWLHAPHAELHGDMPIERVVMDGRRLYELLALLAGDLAVAGQRETTTMPAGQGRPLRLVR